MIFTTDRISVINIITFTLLLASCTGSRYSAESLPEKQLVFGSGGGFSGAVTEYILLENGQLFLRESLTGKTEELSHLGRRKADSIFEELEAMGFKQIELNDPGNLYYFIEWKAIDGDHRLVWGYDLDNKVEPAVKEFYQKLMEMAEEQSIDN